MISHPKFVLFSLNGADVEPSVDSEKTKKMGFLSRVNSALRHFGRRFDFKKVQPLQEASATALRAAGPEVLAGLLALKAKGEDPAAYRELLQDAGARLRMSSQPMAANPRQEARAKTRGWMPGRPSKK